MEESEAYNNLTITTKADESVIQVRIEETKNLIQKLSQEKFEITQKVKEKTVLPKTLSQLHKIERLMNLIHLLLVNYLR